MSSHQQICQKFSLGEIVVTTNCRGVLNVNEIRRALERHVSGDWGLVCEEDWKANEMALVEGLRLMSIYISKTGTEFWIVTEWDRSVTTILLPEDY